MSAKQRARNLVFLALDVSRWWNWQQQRSDLVNMRSRILSSSCLLTSLSIIFIPSSTQILMSPSSFLILSMLSIKDAARVVLDEKKEE